MSKILVIIIAIVVVAAAAGVIVYTQLDEEDADTEGTVTFNGTEFSWDDMQADLGTKTVDGKEGVGLGEVVNDTGLANPDTYKYVLKASDDYAMAVNWTVLQTGIVTMETEEEDGNTTTYLMSYFPGMPSAYKVKNLANIEHTTELTPIVLNGFEFYIDYMPKKVNEKTLVYNETYTVTGYSLSDMVNFTGLASPEAHEYTIVGPSTDPDIDFYTKNVTWDNMLNGVIVTEDVKSVFLGLSKGYMVKNIIEIRVL
jgi:hypothetical protein